MEPAVDYRAIVEELKQRFAAVDLQDTDKRLVGEQMRMRMIYFLDADPSLSPWEVILRLEERWRAEGLIESDDV